MALRKDGSLARPRDMDNAVTLADQHEARMTGNRATAAAILAARYPSMKPEGITRLVDVLLPADGSKPTIDKRWDHFQGKFYTVAYLLGASLGQLAAYRNVTRASVFDAVRRNAPDKDKRNHWRATHGRGGEGITLSGLPIIRAEFDKMVDAHWRIVEEADAYALAQALKNVIDFTD